LFRFFSCFVQFNPRNQICYQPPEVVLRRGRKVEFSHLSFLLLAVVAVVTKTFSDSELHRFLEKDARLPAVLGFSRIPHRTQIMRRLKALVPTAEEQISLFGKQILSAVPSNETRLRRRVPLMVECMKP